MMCLFSELFKWKCASSLNTTSLHNNYIQRAMLSWAAWSNIEFMNPRILKQKVKSLLPHDVCLIHVHVKVQIKSGFWRVSPTLAMALGALAVQGNFSSQWFLLLWESAHYWIYIAVWDCAIQTDGEIAKKDTPWYHKRVTISKYCMWACLAQPSTPLQW